MVSKNYLARRDRIINWCIEKVVSNNYNGKGF
jgi:hypothetical protein